MKPGPMRIRDWDARFERNRTREISIMTWRPEPTDFSDDIYTAIVGHADGAAHFGVLTALRNVAARGKPRGTLTMENGASHTAATLARKTRLPENVIQATITRLLSLGELENTTRKSRVKNRIRPQDGATRPQDGAEIPQTDKRDKKTSSSEEKTGEKKRSERAREFSSAGQRSAAKGDRSLSAQTSPDDDDEAYATPADELKALALRHTGHPITQRLPDHLCSQMGGEIPQVFVDELKSHNGNFRNYPGFIRKLASDRGRPASAPMTAAAAAEKAYRCPVCFSKEPGRGVLSVDRKAVPCKCASSEYVRELIAKGIIEANAQSPGEVVAAIDQQVADLAERKRL